MRRINLTILISITLTSLAGNLYGQQGFLKIYDLNNTINFSNHIIENHLGEFYICGSMLGSTYGALQLLKIDYSGTQVWSREYEWSIGSEAAYSILQKNDSTYLVYGGIYDSIEDGGDTYLLEINENGDTNWLKILDVEYNDKGLFMFQLDDSTIVLAGQYYNLQLTLAHTYLMQTDLEGNIKWVKYYPSTHDGDYPFNLDLCRDKGYIITGSSYNYAANEVKLYLLKIDSTGNKEWRKEYGMSNSQYFGYGLAEDSTYVITGYTKSNDQRDGYLVKVDKYGSVIWQKKYGNQAFNELFKYMVWLPNEGYVLAGGKSKNSTNSDSVTPIIWLQKVDLDGDVIWSRTYLYYNEWSHHYVEDLKQTKDGGYVMTGYTISNDPTNNNILVIKVDSMGCVFPGCAVGIRDLEYSDPVVEVYPNPGYDILNIALKDNTSHEEIFVSITNLEGKVCLDTIIPQGNTSTQVDVSNLPLGIYIITLQDSEGWKHSVKVVVGK